MNPYALRHMILSHACLPIPALPRRCFSAAIIPLDEQLSLLTFSAQALGYNRRGYPIIDLEGLVLSRVINSESAGKLRNNLTRAVVLAIRELMKQPEPNEAAHDLAAFIVLALDEIAQSIDVSVQAWEKRDYWVKADRFRMDWEWAARYAADLRKALRAEDWGHIAVSTAGVAQKLGKITIPQRNRIGTPWVGAYKEFLKKD